MQAPDIESGLRKQPSGIKAATSLKLKHPAVAYLSQLRELGEGKPKAETPPEPLSERRRRSTFNFLPVSRLAAPCANAAWTHAGLKQLEHAIPCPAFKVCWHVQMGSLSAKLPCRNQATSS